MPKEASVSNLIREYSVGSGDDRLTRSIILLCPQHNKNKPNDILRSCKHVDLLAVDPTKYVPDNECIKLSVQTSLAQPISPKKMRTKWKTPTSSQGTKVPIKFSGRPRCIGVEFLSCGTVAECMRTFLGQIQGEAVLIQKYGNMRYFYLFESEDAKKDSLGSKKDKGPAIMPIYYNVRNCKEFHSHHYDTSGSFRLQISAWQPPQSEQKIFRDLRHSETECALAYHENIEKSCMTCLKEMGDNVAIRKMTGSTIQISMPDDFDTAKLAPCITNPNRYTDEPTNCSQFQFLPSEMCEYESLSTASTYLRSYSQPIYEIVMSVHWPVLVKSCLVDLALHHNVLLVSLENKFVWMLPIPLHDPFIKRCGGYPEAQDFYMDASFLRAISSEDMRELIL